MCFLLLKTLNYFFKGWKEKNYDPNSYFTINITINITVNLNTTCLIHSTFYIFTFYFLY